MNINKIDNGYTVEITKKVDANQENDYCPYVYHTYAFKDWDEIINFLKDNAVD